MTNPDVPFRSAKRLVPILAALIAAVGLGLRIASFEWNTRLQGDVNLLALSARELVQHGRLYYPMVYATPDLLPFVTRDPVGTPATQHPPTYPFLAGLIGRAAGTDDTFTILKLLDELGGLALLGALLAMAVSHSEQAVPWLAAGAMAAAAPLLVDFSANGSPYIFSALDLLLAILLLRSFRPDRLRDYVFAGLICGLGPQFHGIVVGLPAAFVVLWIVERKRVRWVGIGAFALAMALTLVPWAIWSEVTLGRLKPPSSTFVLSTLHITSYAQMLRPDVAAHYLKLIGGADRAFAETGFTEIGPFLLILVVIGMVYLVRHDRRAALAVALPEVAYMGIALAWPSFQFRFMTPALIALIVAAGYGFAHLPDLFPAHRRIAWAVGGLLLAGSIGWGLPVYFHQPPTHYYGPGREVKIEKQYPAMEKLAVELSRQPPGMTMGVANLLDGGIETVYWSRQPYVSISSASSVEAIQGRAAEYGVRYIWADTTMRGKVEAAFPGAKIILSEKPFFVYEILGG